MDHEVKGSQILARIAASPQPLGSKHHCKHEISSSQNLAIKYLLQQ